MKPDKRAKLTLTEDQEAAIETLLEQAAQLGIPTTRGAIVREIFKKGFEIYSTGSRQTEISARAARAANSNHGSASPELSARTNRGKGPA